MSPQEKVSVLLAAKSLLLEELEIWEQAGGQKRLKGVPALSILGELANGRGNYDQAKSFYEEATGLLRAGHRRTGADGDLNLLDKEQDLP